VIIYLYINSYEAPFLTASSPNAKHSPLIQPLFLFQIFKKLQDVENPVCVHSSKAIGEPPFFLAVSGYMAIKEALYAFRAQEANAPGYFPLYRCVRFRITTG
jgi:xanthine dehydrogenase/oxidase